MSLFADRVVETTQTTGTGKLDLDGASTGFQSFVAGIGDGNEVAYVISDGVEWEIGRGVVTSASPDTLSRVTVLASSNSGSLVNWTNNNANERDVFSGPSSTFYNTDVLTKTGAYVVVLADFGKLIEVSGGDYTITLPTVASAGNGFKVSIKNVDATGTVTIDGNGSETIDGSITHELTPQYDGVTLRCDGTEWFIEARSHKGALVLLATASASNSATIDFESGELTSKYDEYLLVMTNIIPASESQPYLLTSTDGGANYDVGASDYKWVLRSFSSGTADDSLVDPAASEIKLVRPAIGNDTGEATSINLSISGPSNAATATQFHWEGAVTGTAGEVKWINGAGKTVAVEVVNAIRIIMSSGNITSGEFALYGVSKT